MNKIVLIGAGGHCKVIIDIIKSINEYEIVGITDSNNIGPDIFGVPIIGTDNLLEKLYNSGVKNAFICIGAINNVQLRDKIYYNLKNIGFNIPKLIHKKAIVSSYANVKNGTCVMAGAIINPGTSIGENCIINTGAIIEHDCNIDRNTHISPNSAIAGGCSIGKNCHIGIGSSIIQGINVGQNVIVGAGAIVLNDIENDVTAVGVPAKIIKRR